MAARQVGGGVVDMPDGTQQTTAGAGKSIPTVDATSGTIDLALIDAVFQAGAYVQTMWELVTLRSMNKYQSFNAAYDSLVGFLDDPAKESLESMGNFAILLFAGAASLRGIADPCNAKVSMPGLAPPDSAILPENAEKPSEPASTLPRKSGRYSKKFGAFVIGAMGASAAGIAVVSVIGNRDKKTFPTPGEF